MNTALAVAIIPLKEKKDCTTLSAQFAFGKMTRFNFLSLSMKAVQTEYH